MNGTFRQSMSWLHTWGGLVVGWVLYFMFITGTAGYFDTEIDRWMQPEIPAMREDTQQADMLALAEQYLIQQAANAKSWQIRLPAKRKPLLKVYWQDAQGKSHRETLHPDTGQPVTARDTGGGQQLYRMHYRLHYMPRWLAYYLTSLCAMFMLVILISGVVIHKKIFKDMFTFRPGKNQRSWLDMHNILSVLPLPFHFMITYSGLILLMFTTMFMVFNVSYGTGADDRKRFFDEISSRSPNIEPTGKAATLTALSTLVNEAEHRWGQGSVHRLIIDNPGDSNARVTLRKRLSGHVIDEQKLVFHGVSGALLNEIGIQETASSTQFYKIMVNLHEGQFAGIILRWLYFLSGLMGAGMIATGMILWVAKRRTKAQKTGQISKGLALVEYLNVGTIAGLPIAIAAYFWANRLIPIATEGRANMEINILFITWLIMLVYPLLRTRNKPTLTQTWVQPLALATALYTLLPVINALTTNRHLGLTLHQGDWVMAGFDLSMLCIGLCFGLATYKMQRKSSRKQMEQLSQALPTYSSSVTINTQAPSPSEPSPETTTP